MGGTGHLDTRDDHWTHTMVHVALRGTRTSGDVDLTVGAEACARDLAAAIGGAPADVLAVDGEPVPGDALLRGRLRRGSRITVGAAIGQPAVPALVCVAGWAAGARVALRPGRRYLPAEAGADWRAAPPTDDGYLECDVSADGRCTLSAVDDRTLWVGDRATRGAGPLGLGDRFQFAGSEWQIIAPSRFPRRALEPPGERGGVPFNRPPRERPTREPATVEPPRPPDPYASHARMSWAALAVPLAMGAAFALLFGPLMALFALLTPVLLLGNWLEDRVRARRHRRRTSAAYAEAITHFADALRAAAAAEAGAQRTARPALGETVARVLRADPRLWERRPGDDDFMRVAIGRADVRGTLVLERPGAAVAHQDLPGPLQLRDVPAVVDLSAAHMLGIVGDRARRTAVARALVTRVSSLHGPADVRVCCLGGAARSVHWDWLKWLPHTRFDAGSGRRLLAFEGDDIDLVLSTLIDGAFPGGAREAASPLVLAVVDAPELGPARAGLLRDLYAGAGPPVAALVLADDVLALPARCSTVVDVGSRDGEMPSVTRVAQGRVRGAIDEPVDGRVRLEGTTEAAARASAMALAALDDPELREPGAALPSTVSLATLSGLSAPTAGAVAHRWRDGAAAGDGLPAVLGARESGMLAIDLVTDGPHALLAGTTGSGKSELLRTLVCSLALTTDPDHVNFVLVDYKGGSAFDACARLPHVVGVVTDLDEHLGRRALVCLEAELRHREARLRASGVSDVAGYRAVCDPDGPLPRLVVVVDEFAALARELPDFMRSLVDIAQRGRSLGVHLVLATQRPAGVVNDQIRANTNLRIALRVQSPADSADVLDAPVAAHIARGHPGRGFARLGPGDLVAFQCAFVSGVTGASGADASVAITPFVARAEQPVAARPATPRGVVGVATDLERAVDAIAAAAARLGLSEQRAPWPPPLPATLTLESLGAPGATAEAADGPEIAIGLIDDPERQRQLPWCWRGSDGHLWCCGAPGSGATEALVTLAVSAAARLTVDELHIYAVDCGPRRLAPLAALPHTGAVVFGDERERLVRLVSLLEEEGERRRGGQRGPELLVLIDRYDELPAVLDGPGDLRVLDRIARLVRSGRELGIHVALSTQRPGGLPVSVAAALTQRLVFALPDRQDYAAFGLRAGEVPELPPLRAMDAASAQVVQLARVDDVTTTARAAASGTRPRPIETLPHDVPVTAIIGAAAVHGDEWSLPIGIGARRLEPVGFRLGAGDHALIVGPPRSGRTAVLEAIATAARTADRALAITVVAPRRSRLADCRSASDVLTGAEAGRIAAALRASGRPRLVLIDDADRVDDAAGELATALREEHPELHVIAAARSDVVRTAYTHWTRQLRASRQLLALQPDAELDGDLIGATLPRDRAASGSGRGYLLDGGELELVQCARG